MNNFIVGQVTPDMLSKMTYGTYIFFGLLTFMGAGFIWAFFPETKVCKPKFLLKNRTNSFQGLSLEEMDILFGSVGIAEREKQRWKEVHDEVGLTELVARSGFGGHGDSGHDVAEKEAVDEKPTLSENTQTAPVKEE